MARREPAALKANIRKRSGFLPLAYVRTLGKCCNERRRSQGEASVRNSSSDFDGASTRTQMKN